MTDKTVLVTGAAGFVGSHLVEEMLRLGNRVVGFDTPSLNDAKNLELVASHPQFTYAQGDIRSLPSLEAAFTKEIQTVFHLASVVGIQKYIEDPFQLVDISVGGTRNVAELALRYGTQIVFTSTSEIYGRNLKVPWSEDDDRVLGSTRVDRWSYATAKACCEHLLLGLHKKRGVPLVIVRYFNVYGPRQNPIFIVSQSIKKVLNGESPLLYDSGSQTRCFTYVGDIVQGTLAAASSEKSNGDIFNIGNTVESSIADIIALVIKQSGTNLHWKPLDTKKQYGDAYEDIERRIPDVSKAKQVFGWEASTPHEEGIRRTIEWARENVWWLAS